MAAAATTVHSVPDAATPTAESDKQLGRGMAAATAMVHGVRMGPLLSRKEKQATKKQERRVSRQPKRQWHQRRADLPPRARPSQPTERQARGSPSLRDTAPTALRASNDNSDLRQTGRGRPEKHQDGGVSEASRTRREYLAFKENIEI
ncbi:hypothetical protein JRQ81_016710 [Phrynocephalus forsythii]|uniref:Uncharacterized protein n=1 Tax=Phrynocephalus forsythii TaxID=171643 RepID=A0A9Q0XSR4_9SAUR|nr:hypothetical protein JRQ81_016710 [Phrynocephalus forsythii]